MDFAPGRQSAGRLAAKEAALEEFRNYRLQFIYPVLTFVLVSSLTMYVTTWTAWTIDGLHTENQYAAPEAALGMLVEASAFVLPIFLLVYAGTWILRGVAEKKYMLMSLGMLMVVATASAVFVGYVGYSWYMRLYNAYEDGRGYDNVLPTEPAAAHIDAGKIIFSSTARVDETKSIGFNDGMMYCVAPIVAPNQGSRIEYWAVGTNCCGRRSKFFCDAAGKGGQGGIVQLDSGFFRTNAISVWSLAVKVAEAQFDLQSSPHALFVKYVADPDYEHQLQFNHAMLLWAVASGIHLIVNTLLALLSKHVGASKSK